MTPPKEGMAQDHLKVSEGRVVDFLRQLGGWIKATSVSDITPKFVIVLVHIVTQRKLRNNIMASLKTQLVAELIQVEDIFSAKQPKIDVSPRITTVHICLIIKRAKKLQSQVSIGHIDVVSILLPIKLVA